MPIATKPMPVNAGLQNQPLQQTPAGQYGDINTNRYTGSQNANTAGMSNGRAGINLTGGNPNNNPNATQWNTNYGPVDTGTDAFRQFGDRMYDHTMGRMRGDIDQRNAQLSQQLINRGIREGSEAYNAEMDRMTRGNNDLMSAAALGAEQLGLQAQNQYFGQEMANNQFGLQQANQNYGQQFGYDQLANALAQSRIGANATLGAANASANASRYNAGLNHQLGTNQLNEQSRQFDINNIYNTNGQNQQFMLGMGNLYNNMMGQGLNQWNAQNNANNMWYQQAGQMANNAPGVIFNPNMGYTGDQINANANHMNAVGADTQMVASLLGGAIGMSDKRLKENIEKVGRENGINIYEFEYKDKAHGSGRYRGVMAQEIEHKYPDAIHWYGNRMAVDYSKLPVKMERVA